MERWYRVFGGAGPCDPAVLLSALQTAGALVQSIVHADEQGWFRIDFTFPDGRMLALDRYRADEDGIRAELNSWAAWVETLDDAATLRLMERFIQTVQLFVFVANSENEDRYCELLCHTLATTTGGVYQVDGRGLFGAEGTLLLAEE